MKKVLRIGEKGKVKLDREEWEAASDLQTKVAIIQIQDLISLGLAAVTDVLAQEVEELVGSRYSRETGMPGHCRWGSKRGRYIWPIRSSLDRMFFLVIPYNTI